MIYDERFLRYASDPAWQSLASSSADEEAIDVLNKLLGSRPEEGHSPSLKPSWKVWMGQPTLAWWKGKKMVSLLLPNCMYICGTGSSA